PYLATYSLVMSLTPPTGSGSSPRNVKRPGKLAPALHGTVPHTRIAPAGAVGTLSLRATAPRVFVIVRPPTGFVPNRGYWGGSSTWASPINPRFELILTKSWQPVSRPDLPRRLRLETSAEAAFQAARCSSVSARQRADTRPNRERTFSCAGLRGSFGTTYRRRNCPKRFLKVMKVPSLPLCGTSIIFIKVSGAAACLRPPACPSTPLRTRLAIPPAHYRMKTRTPASAQFHSASNLSGRCLLSPLQISPLRQIRALRHRFAISHLPSSASAALR